MAAKKSTSGWVLALLMALAVVTTLLGPAAAGRLRATVHWAFAPLGDVGMYLTTTVKHSTRPSPNLTREQAEHLREQNDELRRKLQTVETEALYWKRVAQNGRVIFSELFGPRRDAPVRLIAARVVIGDSMPYGWTRIVNVGRRQGAADGMYVTQRRLLTDRSETLPANLAVLSGTTVVGRLLESGPFTARLQMVVDRGFQTPAQVLRVIDPAQPRLVLHQDQTTRLMEDINEPIEVVAFGDGSPLLFVPEVRKTHGIQAGDILQMRPYVGALPEPVEIGRVTHVMDDAKNAGMVELKIKPSADLPSLRDVYIVVPKLDRLQPQGGS
jgi:cell shape-determining protein MreC